MKLNINDYLLYLSLISNAGLLFSNILQKSKNKKLIQAIKHLNFKTIEYDRIIENNTDKFKQLILLYNASNFIFNTEEETALIENIPDILTTLFKVKGCVFYTFNQETRKFELIKSIGNIPYPKEIDYNSQYIINEVSEKSISKIIISKSENVKKVLGFIKLYNKYEDFNKMETITNFNDIDKEIFEIITNQIAMALDKIRNYKLMKRMALTDQLTQLYNRNFAQIRIKEELNRAQRYKQPISVILLDIDKFKSVNDTYGHDVGDEALKHVANIIKQNEREYDLAIRWGGEEFLVLLPNTTIDNAYIVAERLRKAVENSNFDYCKLTISVGVAEYPYDLNTKNFYTDIKYMHDIINLADKALYFSKQNGRNQVNLYKNIRHLIND